MLRGRIQQETQHDEAIRAPPGTAATGPDLNMLGAPIGVREPDKSIHYTFTSEGEGCFALW